MPSRRPGGFSAGRLILFALLLVLVAALAWDEFGPAAEDPTVEISDDGAGNGAEETAGDEDDAALGGTADQTGGELQDEAQSLDESVDEAEPQTGEVLDEVTEGEASEAGAEAPDTGTEEAPATGSQGN